MPHDAHGMGHSHGSTTGALKVSGWLTGIYFVAELAIGVWSGSIAIISDAFHTFSAVGGVLVALVAARMASRPATFTASFGLIRAEIVGALINGLFLAGMALVVIWMSVMRLQDPIEISTTPMLIAAAGGLVTEVISISLLFRMQRSDLNVRGAYWHVLQTFVGSVVIVVGALVIRFTGFYAIDPILGGGFGLVLLWASWGITRDALAILLDTVPKDLDLAALTATVTELPGVLDVHHPHAWALTSGKNVVSMHVLIEEDQDAQTLLNEVQFVLTTGGVYFSTVQLETECHERSVSDEIDLTRSAGANS